MKKWCAVVDIFKNITQLDNQRRAYGLNAYDETKLRKFFVAFSALFLFILCLFFLGVRKTGRIMTTKKARSPFSSMHKQYDLNADCKIVSYFSFKIKKKISQRTGNTLNKVKFSRRNTRWNHRTFQTQFQYKNLVFGVALKNQDWVLSY